MSEPVIGRNLFTDGAERPVYEDADGQQYVVNDDEDRVEGVWLMRRLWSQGGWPQSRTDSG
jgi:hypothetical protein